MANLGPVKIKVTLDTEEARRQIAELKAAVGRPAPSGPASSSTGTPAARVEANANAKRTKLLEQLHRELQATKNLKRVGKGASAGSQPDDHGGRSVLGILAGAAQGRAVGAALSSPVAGMATAAAGSGIFSSAAAKGIGTAALVYGALRIGTEQQVLMMEMLNGMLPAAIKDSPVFKGLQEFYEGLAKRFDALESSVIGAFKTVSSVKDYGTASARISGDIPGVMARVPAQLRDDWIVETQKERLEYRFGLFRRKQLASDLGRSLGEMISGWNR